MKAKVLFFVLFALFTMSCQKELIPIVDETLYEVQFAPQLYGDVVPWLRKSDNNSKGFTDFQHKFLNHVIRLRTSLGVFIIDIPIVAPSLSNTYSYNLPVGDYTAEIIPITDESLSGNGTYTAFTNFVVAINRAAIYTRNAVPFTITGALMSPIVINCVTDYACLQYNLSGTTYIIANVPIPTLMSIGPDPGFINYHSIPGQEQAINYLELIGERDKPNVTHYVGMAAAESLVWLSNTAFWYDNASNIYYCYYIPGTPDNMLIPIGTGTSQTISQTTVLYLGFDFEGGTGGSYPTIWCKDRYPSRTWVSNTTLRISYTFGAFTVQQSDWFTTIINN